MESAMCSTELRQEILGGVPFFAMLPASAIEQINRRFREQGFNEGEPIFYAGNPAAHLYVVATGKVKLMRHTLAGQDVLLDILTTGEFFGRLSVLNGETYPDTAIAQTAVCALSVGAEEFRAILTDYPSAALAVLDITAARLREAQEMIRQISAYSVEHRIAHTLLKLADKLGEPQDVGLLIQMPLSREDLANMAGSTTESASRIVSQFQRDGLIATGRQWIAITDQDRLRQLASEAD
jgi:CRP-like cAMP-binding protein